MANENDKWFQVPDTEKIAALQEVVKEIRQICSGMHLPVEVVKEKQHQHGTKFWMLHIDMETRFDNEPCIVLNGGVYINCDCFQMGQIGCFGNPKGNWKKGFLLGEAVYDAGDRETPPSEDVSEVSQHWNPRTIAMQAIQHCLSHEAAMSVESLDNDDLAKETKRQAQEVF